MFFVAVHESACVKVCGWRPSGTMRLAPGPSSESLVFKKLATLTSAIAILSAPIAQASEVNEQQAYDIGLEAYIYLYPLVTMDMTRRQATNIEADKMPGRGPINTFAHIRSYPSADWKEVVRPNFDTLYSLGWLDLMQGQRRLDASRKSRAEPNRTRSGLLSSRFGCTEE
jgi:hypothetical protein